MILKAWILSLSLIFVSHSQASNVIFLCTSQLKIDASTSVEIGIQVVKKKSTLKSYLVGSNETNALETDFQFVSFKDSLEIGGVKHILNVLNLKSQQLNKITHVEIYTAGNFEDDAAGVRAANFVDKNGNTVAQGMFFGWAGPVRCQ